jgi:uncharacterized BrkB/YihY/UPF0761 family membrane protein
MAPHPLPGGERTDSGVDEADPLPPPADADVAEPRTVTGRVHRWVSRCREWTGAERVRVEHTLEERRGTSKVIGAGFDIRELDLHVGGGILAGAVAFRMFLFLVPFVYVVFSLIGLTARTLSEDPDQLARSVGITGVLASAVVDNAHLSLLSEILLLGGALVALVLTANSLAKTFSVVHWLVWRFAEPRPRGRRAIGGTIGIALVLTVLSVAANALRSRTGFLGSLLVVVVLTGASFALWWRVSWRLPHAPGPAQMLVPGAVLVALGADVMHALTTYWIGPLVDRKSTTYGAVGIALAVLFWVYVFGRIIVASAGVNVTLWRRAGGVVADATGDPSEA